ncbi:MAG: protease inhibitor I42 family protein [Dehalococcoidia bacterium]
MNIVKWSVFGLAIATIGFAPVACGDDDENDDQTPPAELQLTEADNGTNVVIANDGTVIVALASNPTTGYSWAIVSPEPTNLELDGEPKYVPAGSTTPVVGAGGTQVFTFKTTAPGTSTLKMEYRRSFEPANPAEKTFEVTVEVR